jgi:DNA-binding response OmpR family regulator
MARTAALHLVTTSRRRPPRTVLVVDDDVALGRTLGTALEFGGYTIIKSSAGDGQVDRMLGRRPGAADFLAKPFDLDDLQARIEAVLPGVRNVQGTISEPIRSNGQRQA